MRGQARVVGLVALVGRWPILLGQGFSPGVDVVLEIDRANGSHATLTVNERAELHTDSAGRFGLAMPPLPGDLGTNVVTASAGCTATMETVVTADQLPGPCPDPARGQVELMDSPAYRAAVQQDAPVHWWHFDEAGGPTSVDSVGGADGQWVADPVPVTGVGGTRSLSFDGLGSYVEVSALTFGDFTLEAWVFLCDYVDNQDAIVGNGLSAPSVNFFEQRLRLFTAEQDDVVIAGTTATIGQWQHWALTRDASGTRIYLNGALDATGPPWSGTMVINQIGRGDAGFLRGGLDELAFYDRALDSEALTAHSTAR